MIALLALAATVASLFPMRNPASQYGITRFRVGYRVAAFAVFAAALRRRLIP